MQSIQDVRAGRVSSLRIAPQSSGSTASIDLKSIIIRTCLFDKIDLLYAQVLTKARLPNSNYRQKTHHISEKKKEKKPNASASSLCRSIFADYLFSVVAFGATGAAGFAAAGAAGFDAAAGAFFTLSSLLRGARRSRMVIAFFGHFAAHRPQPCMRREPCAAA